MLFWKKDKIELERGDSVKVKKGVKFPKLKINISDWQGRVFEVDKRTIEIELDSITLKNFNETLFKHYQEIEEYPHLITIPKKDVEKTEPRDNYDEVELAQDELIEKIDSYNKTEPQFQKLSRNWVRHFIRSDYYSTMEKIRRQDTDSVIELFTNQMYDYEEKTPKKWNVRSAKEVFLNWAPNKISADKRLFESYGAVLLNYFKFLEERRYLKTKPLQELLLKVKEEIVIRSQDSSNWGMAKSFMMGAKQSGVNLDNKLEMDRYLQGEQLKALKIMNRDQGANSKGKYKVDKRKFKGIWRNQKVTVKYQNGEYKEDVKFKDVESDLLNGFCKLISSFV